jgi:hypothetical protein
MAVPILAVLGVASPFIAQYIQTTGAQLQAEAEHRQQEMRKANLIADEVSQLMDNLVFFITEVMFGIVLRGKETPEGTLPDYRDRLPFEPDRIAWEKYRENLLKWEGSKTRYRALAQRYFGDVALASLIEIQNDIEQLERYINAAFFMRKESKDYIDNDKSSKNYYQRKFFRVKDPLMVKMTNLSQFIIKQIQEQNILLPPAASPDKDDKTKPSEA